jgi:hypothetical protein
MVWHLHTIESTAADTCEDDCGPAQSAGRPAQETPEVEGIDVTPSTPEQFAAHARAEIEKWTKVVIAAKLEAD